MGVDGVSGPSATVGSTSSREEGEGSLAGRHISNTVIVLNVISLHAGGPRFCKSRFARLAVSRRCRKRRGLPEPWVSSRGRATVTRRGAQKAPPRIKQGPAPLLKRPPSVRALRDGTSCLPGLGWPRLMGAATGSLGFHGLGREVRTSHSECFTPRSAAKRGMGSGEPSSGGLGSVRAATPAVSSTYSTVRRYCFS